MGTNYYLRRETRAACASCGRGPDIYERHIGKKSFGWAFALHVIPSEGITSLDDWTAMFGVDGVWIVDEYDRPVTADEMLKIITLGDPDCARSVVDGCNCVGRGVGTWDLIKGEFT